MPAMIYAVPRMSGMIFAGHLPGCRHDMILMCVMRGGIAHRMHRMIHCGMRRVSVCIVLGWIFLWLSVF